MAIDAVFGRPSTVSLPIGDGSDYRGRVTCTPVCSSGLRRKACHDATSMVGSTCEVEMPTLRLQSSSRAPYGSDWLTREWRMSLDIRRERRGFSWRINRLGLVAVLLALLGGCATPNGPQPSLQRPDEVRANIVRLLPSGTRDAQGWAIDIYAAFSALRIDPDDSNLCASLAVIAQESSFHADPAVPGLAGIARAEIDRRAGDLHIPKLAVRAALHIKSPDGRRYDERIAAVRSEGELSRIYEDVIGSVPLGKRLFADANPVRTGGPMQVSVAFSEAFAGEHSYPYPVDGSIRHEVFTRRGGLCFGIAHLLAYPAHYEKLLYRFADFNAGRYASRNAAFQDAVSRASGIPLVLDGDLIRHGRVDKASQIGATELAVRSLAASLDLSNAQIRRDLEKGDRSEFEDTRTWRGVFALAERTEGHPLARAHIPRIRLESPKITRKLTTQWFATRVDQRYQACMEKTVGSARSAG